MSEQFAIGDPVFMILREEADRALGAPGRIIHVPSNPDGLYSIKVHRERGPHTCWVEKLIPVTEQDYFLMCLRYEPAPFYKED